MVYSRQASSTLKGFQYQFDKTILQILSDRRNQPVIVEGVEDFDVLSNETKIEESVQCKYHELSRYSKDLIKKPVLKMFEDFKNRNSELKYRLFIHLGSIPKKYDLENITLEQWRGILDINQIDKILDKFLTNHMIVEFGQSLEEQKKNILLKIQEAFSTQNPEEKELLYLALQAYISQLGTKALTKDRKITRQQLIKKFQTSQQKIFYAGYSRWQGEEQYIKFLKKVIKSKELFKPTKNKLIFLDLDSLDISTSQALHFIKEVIEKHYKVGQAFNDTKPFIICMKSSESTKLRDLKEQLLFQSIWFNDGYEEIEFNTKYFLQDPIIETKRSKNGNYSNRLSRSSFSIKLISHISLKQAQTEIASELHAVFFVSSQMRFKDYFPNDFVGCVLPIQTGSIDTLTQLLCY